MFRKEALERLSSPEQLDQLLRITSPRGWLVLLGLGLLIGAALVWSLLGSIPATIAGEGILIHGEGVQLIDAPQSGQLMKLLVNAGDLIQANQVVATMTADSGTIEVRSVRAGRVLELRASEGTFVQAGTALVSFELSQEDLEVVLYLQPSDGKKVNPGMAVQISPSNISSQTYGVLVGTVKSVSDFPLTTQGMYRVLGSDELVRALSSKGAPIEVRVALTKADTPTGYQWSSPAGPPSTLHGGTFCTATIILGEFRPINMVIG